MNLNEPIIGITMGDPAGIGPEIILKTIKNKKVNEFGKLVVIGDKSVLKEVNKKLNFNLKINELNNLKFSNLNSQVVNVIDLNNINVDDFAPGKISDKAGYAAVEYVKKAVDLALDDVIDAMVTAPINKKAIRKAGFNYPGHTEILAEKTDTENYAMMLYSSKLNVIHVTTHMALKEACEKISNKRIENVIKLANDTMKKLNIDNPKIAVAGLNPHAGEKGIFGKEEIDIIKPAINKAKNQEINVFGPISPDTVFVRAVEGEYDIVVVMYHDQGHIPVKLLGFDSGVNVTVGLPIIRTSVDHGTAFDIAWEGKAYDTSLVEAIKVAYKMSN